MFGFPLKYILIGVACLAAVASVWAHVAKDNARRELIITLQVDLRTSESNFQQCDDINESNATVMLEQQASIDKFAAEHDEALTRAEDAAAQLAEARVIHEQESKNLRTQIQIALANDTCANTVIPDADVLRVLNDAIRSASSG